MNQQLSYYLAQAHTADLLRTARRQRLADEARRRQRRPRSAVRRIADSARRARTNSVPTVS